MFQLLPRPVQPEERPDPRPLARPRGRRRQAARPPHHLGPRAVRLDRRRLGGRQRGPEGGLKEIWRKCWIFDSAYWKLVSTYLRGEEIIFFLLQSFHFDCKFLALTNPRHNAWLTVRNEVHLNRLSVSTLRVNRHNPYYVLQRPLLTSWQFFLKF